MYLLFRATLLSIVVLLSACGFDLEHDGAFDPDSPPERQAKSILYGTVKLEGETDHAGVDVLVQNDERTYTVATAADGAYTITGVVPGRYMLTVSTRYFNPVTRAIEVPLGRRLNLGDDSILAKRSTVKGSAIAKRLTNRQFVDEGGVVVSLTKSESIRGGAVTAPVSPAAFQTADSIDLPENSTISGHDGSFSLSGVPAGIYLIVASSPGISTLQVGKITVTGEGDVILADIVLEAVTGFFDIMGTADWVPSSLYTNSPDVTLKLSGFNAEQMRIGNSVSGDPEDCVLDPVETFSPTVVHALPQEGRNTVCVQYLAKDGRASAVLTNSIVRDTLAPDPNSISVLINAGGLYFDDNRVTVGLSAFDGNTGVDRMIMSERADFAGAVTQTYVPRMVYGFPVTDGPRELWVKFGDRAGNYSAAVSAFVVVDKAAPLLTQFYVLNAYGEVVSAANPSRTSQVVVHVHMTDANPMEVLISDRIDFAGASWIPYRPDIIWNFIPPTVPDGALQTLYVKVRDAAGHVIGLPDYQVAVDTIAPQNVAIDLRGNGVLSADLSTTVRDVTVNFAYPPADTDWIEISADGSFNNRLRFAARPSTSYTVPDLDGVKPVYARFIDRAGNVSATVQDQIVLDTTPPQLAAVTLPDGRYTSEQNVRLNTTAADAYQMQVTEGTSCGGTWSSYQTVVIHNFLTSTQEWKNVSVRFRDGAGNPSACLTQQVLYDNTPPSSTPFEAVDSAYNPINTSNVLRYYIHLKVTDASPVTVQYNEIQYWSNIQKEQVDLGTDVYRPWDVKAPAFVTGETRNTYVRLEDAAGNWQVIGPISVNVVLLAASMQIPTATRNLNINVLIGTSNATRLWVSESADFTGYREYALLPTTTTVPFALSDSDGVKTLYGRFYSSDGSFADTNATTRLDRVAPYVPLPVVANMNINGNAGTTNLLSGAVDLTLRAEDATTSLKEMKVANLRVDQNPALTCSNALTNAAAQSYQTYLTWSLAATAAATEGYRYVCAQFSDTVGNWSTPVSDAIWYDTQFPVAGGQPLLIDGGSAYTSNKSGLVSLTLSATGATWMRFANDGYGYSGWYQYSDTQSWSIPPQQGTHSVRVQFADSAMNIIGPYTQTIIRDTIAPYSPGLNINSASQNVTNSATVTLNFTAVGADYVLMSNDTSFAFPVSTPYAPSYAGWALLGNQGYNYAYVKYRDWAGNETYIVGDWILYDSQPPYNRSLTVAGGAAAVSDATGAVTLGFAAADTWSSLGNRMVANLGANASCADALQGVTPQPFYSAVGTWTLDNPGTGIEGWRYVCARYSDAVFNWSPPVSDAVWFDTKQPVVSGAGLYINAGSALTNSTLVELSFSQSGATEVQFANDLGGFGSWTPLAPYMNWTINAGEGIHSVWVRFRDTAGNVNGPYAAYVTLDTTAPQGTSIAIQGNVTGYTSAATVDLDLFGGSEAVSMDVSNTGLFGPADRYAYDTVVLNWPLSAGQGSKVIWARFIDLAGNASTPVSTSIVYDSVAPVPDPVVVNAAGQAVTNATLITAYVSASGTPSEMYVSLDACKAGGTWEPVAASKDLTLAAGERTYAVYAAFRDLALNESACVAHSIRLDQTITSTFTVAFTGPTVYAGRTSGATGPLVFTGLTTDVTEIAAADNAAFAGAAWQPASATIDVPLALGGNTYYAKVRDAAGNTSSVKTAAIIVDRSVSAPVLQLADITGDGKAVSMSSAELRWDTPMPESDVVRFDILRSVNGGAFATLAAIDCTGACDSLAAELSYAAAVTVNTTYGFKVRARDVLGNTAESAPVYTAPAEPVRNMYRISAADHTFYTFAPASVTYAYDGGNAFDQGSISTLNISHYSDPRWNEQLLAAVLDPYGAFAWESTFSTGRAWSGTLDAAATAGVWAAIDVDTYGYVHIVYRRAGQGLYYRTNQSGAWQETTVEAGAAVGDYAAIRVDATGIVHIAYYDATPGISGMRLRYAKSNGAGFSLSTAVNNTGGVRYNGAWLGMDVGPDLKVNLAYLSEDTASVKVAYVKGDSTLFGVPTILDDIGVPAANQGLTAALRVTDGSVKVAYYHAGQQEIRFVEKASGAGAFSAPVTLDTASDVGQYSAIDVARDGTVHLAYIDSAAQQVRYLTRSGATWSAPDPVPAPDAVTGEVSLRLDARQRVRLAYGTAGGLILNRLEQGAWAPVVIDGTAGAGLFNGLALDRNGKAHFVYAGAGASTAKYAAVDTFGWLANPVDGLSAVNTASLALDAYGRRHVVYRSGTTLYYANDIQGRWRTWSVDSAMSIKGRPYLYVDNLASKVYITYLPSSGSDNKTYLKEFNLATEAFGSREQAADNAPTEPSGTVIRIQNFVVVAYQQGSNMKVAYKTPGLSTWTDQRAVSTSDVAGSYPAMTYVPGTDYLYLAFYGSSQLKVARFNDATDSWYAASTVDNGGGTLNVGKYPSIFYAQNTNRLHLAYANVSSNQLRYTTSLHGATLAWSAPAEVDSAGAVIEDIAVVADAAGAVHITYYVTGVGLKYATNATGAWVVQTLANSTASPARTRGTSNSLAIDAAGKLHTGYVDLDTAAGNGDYTLHFDFAGWLKAASIRQAR